MEDEKLQRLAIAQSIDIACFASSMARQSDQTTGGVDFKGATQ
jgi:hypothetical protein